MLLPLPLTGDARTRWRESATGACQSSGGGSANRLATPARGVAGGARTASCPAADGGYLTLAACDAHPHLDGPPKRGRLTEGRDTVCCGHLAPRGVLRSSFDGAGPSTHWEMLWGCRRRTRSKMVTARLGRGAEPTDQTEARAQVVQATYITDRTLPPRVLGRVDDWESRRQSRHGERTAAWPVDSRWPAATPAEQRVETTSPALPRPRAEAGWPIQNGARACSVLTLMTSTASGDRVSARTLTGPGTAAKMSNTATRLRASRHAALTQLAP